MHLKIGQRILAAFTLIVGLTIGLGVYQTSNIANMRDLSESIVGTDFKALSQLRRIAESQREVQFLKERAVVLYFYGKADLSDRDSEVLQQQWAIAHQRTAGQIDELGDFAAAQIDDTQEPTRRQLYAEIAEQTGRMRQLLAEIVRTSETQFALLDHDDLLAIRSTIPVLDDLRRQFEDLNTRTAELARQLPQNAERSINARFDIARSTSLYAVLAVAAIGLLTAWMLYRSITGPLAEFTSFVERVGRGDLTQQTRNTGSDELGRLGQFLNAMVGGLGQLARQSRDATGQLHAATSELQASDRQTAAGQTGRASGRERGGSSG